MGCEVPAGSKRAAARGNGLAEAARGGPDPRAAVNSRSQAPRPAAGSAAPAGWCWRRPPSVSLLPSFPRAMDVSRGFFGKLRALALTLEKEAKQLERALRREDPDSEDESPVRVLHDLHCEVRTLKGDVNTSLDKSCSERQEIQDFMKASEILMQRNAADLGKIRELFQKYGYKPPVKDSTDEEEEEINSQSKVSVQNKSDQEKVDDVPHLPACTEKPLVPRDPLHHPQLSDFGLSQYAFSRSWSALNGQHPTNAHQENSKNRTPLKTQAPSILPKTPKCMLRMDDYECLTPKLEHFGISEHTMCMNEDYTMALIHKTAQTSKNLPKKDDHEVNVAEMTSREIMVTPGPKTKETDGNAADCMASPLIPVFCTPGVKIPSRTDGMVLSKSPETNEIRLPSHTGTPPLPDFETRWLKIETKGEKTESVTENDATNKLYIEDSIPSAVSSDEYLKHFEDPSPPKIKDYEHLINTPPPPEITRIPDDVLQILSKYNQKIDSSKAKKMETKAGNTTRFESNFTDYCNKENRHATDENGLTGSGDGEKCVLSF
ncbi:spindle and kinetochore-associated protein 3 isoform X4 [Apteryx mantelli]|uniref:Spindle and kinetochore-associated protein 3 isoform X4 n=1 Tax=Apteryx mantelli TaxID=2696672 RepID=A0ABM4E1L2_9AVES